MDEIFTVVLTLKSGVQIRYDGITDFNWSEARDNDLRLIKFTGHARSNRKVEHIYVRLDEVAAVHREIEVEASHG